MTFIRFETSLIHEDTKKPCGIFQGLRILENRYFLEDWEVLICDEFRETFEILDAPSKISDYDSKRWISWFYGTSKTLINECYKIFQIYESRGIIITIRKETDLMNIVYRDKYQVFQIDKRIYR